MKIDDIDEEIQEWRDSLDAIIHHRGKEAAVQVLDALEEHAKACNVVYNPHGCFVSQCIQ